MTKRAFLSLAFLALSACGDIDDEDGPGSSFKGLSAGSCSALFSDRFQITGAGWSTRLSGSPPMGLSTSHVWSFETDDGFFEDCGRSDARGSYATSYFPFTDDYVMTLRLDNSASCGDKTVVITGNCNSDGATGSASWNGKPASVVKIGR